MAECVEKTDPRTPKELVRYIGGKGIYKGYFQLATSIEIAMEDEDHLLRVMKDIYGETARQHQTTCGCVQKNLRKLVEVIWEGAGPGRLEQLTGIHYSEAPSVGLLIDDLADYLRKKNAEG